MKVRILRTGPYRDVQPSGKHGARVYQVGDEVEFEAQYARAIIEAGLAEEAPTQPPPQAREESALPQVTVNWRDLTVKQLKEECRKRELPVSGRKSTLVGRLEKDDAFGAIASA